MPPDRQDIRRFRHHAMATVFEIMMIHDDAPYAEQCAHQAFRHVDKIELDLSKYIENSDVSRINRAGTGKPVRVGLNTFESLEHCARLSNDTKGAWDITIGPLVAYWSRHESPGEELARIHKTTGMHLVHLEEAQHTVTLRSDEMSIDLGGYGKGYAVDRMAEVLADWDIDRALISAGQSSILALAAPPGKTGWVVTMRDPSNLDHIIERVFLERQALSSSGLRKRRHIIDPRTALPATDTRAAWTLTKDAGSGDALSTAFMILSPEEIEQYCENHACEAVILIGNSPEAERFGFF